MNSLEENRKIATLIVGAMAIDGSLNSEEREKVARALRELNMEELISDIGVVIDEGTYESTNLFKICRELRDDYGQDADELSALVFRIICEVVAHDRYVSEQESAYLSAMSKRLELSVTDARNIFKGVLFQRRSRIESSGRDIDAALNPHLKELLSFEGADSIRGEAPKEALAEVIHTNSGENGPISFDDVTRAMNILGLDGRSKLTDAEHIWRETINNLNLPKMANMGETFVTAALARISKINEAYKLVLSYYRAAEANRLASK
mgnify:CR=1 FL=1